MLDLWSVKSEYRPLLEKSANIDIEDDNASANMIRSFFIISLIMYTSAQPLPIGAFGMSIDIAKIRLLYDNVSCFNEKFIGMKQISSIAH